MKNTLTPITRSKLPFFDKNLDDDDSPMIIVPRSMFWFFVILSLMEGATLMWIFLRLGHAIPHGAH